MDNSNYVEHVEHGLIDNVSNEVQKAKLEWLGTNSKQDDQRFGSMIKFQDHFLLSIDINDFTPSFEILSWISCNCKIYDRNERRLFNT